MDLHRKNKNYPTSKPFYRRLHHSKMDSKSETRKMSSVIRIPEVEIPSARIPKNRIMDRSKE
ncbi:hypothetical protein TorRG33x02_272080 [Trema orientale]|uniref:Uncharacterized protein n=1 Tax=Trema orientale TaxID=63057 RepID=A0A2P5CVG8_TREOI|nr:hypothetical protein TorRG33x02_272080 [Trema orientale]